MAKRNDGDDHFLESSFVVNLRLSIKYLQYLSTYETVGLGLLDALKSKYYSTAIQRCLLFQYFSDICSSTLFPVRRPLCLLMLLLTLFKHVMVLI